jgi:hypothetical protein
MSDSKYITLVSGEGFEFVVLREAALVSPTIKGMLRSQFSEAQTGRCTFPEIRYASLLSTSHLIISLNNDDNRTAVFAPRQTALP